MALLLLQKGAAVDARDAFEQTPLHYASLNGEHDLATTLLQRGAVPTSADHTGATPLDKASDEEMRALLRGTVPGRPALRSAKSRSVSPDKSRHVSSRLTKGSIKEGEEARSAQQGCARVPAAYAGDDAPRTPSGVSLFTPPTSPRTPEEMALAAKRAALAATLSRESAPRPRAAPRAARRASRRAPR